MIAGTRHAHKLVVVGILAIACVICIAAITPFRVDVHTEQLMNCKDQFFYDELSQTRTQIISSTDWTVTWGDVCIAKRQFLFGKEELLVILPYSESEVRDIGTAGSQSWMVQLRTVTLAYKNAVKENRNDSYLRNVSLQLNADANTAIASNGNTLTVPTDRLIDCYTEGADWFVVPIKTATRDSELNSNALCEVAIEWTGEIAIPGGLSGAHISHFAIRNSASYTNNKK